MKISNHLQKSKRITLQIAMTLTMLLFYQSVNAQDKAKDSEEAFTIENCVNTFSLEQTDKTKVGYQYWFVDKHFVDGRTIKMSVVEPHGATHAPHTHENDEFFYILEGSAKFHLNGENTIVGPNTTLYCPPNSTHGISNAGDTELKYLVLKKYDVEKK
ncbi:cupin domain-containing protein [Portibacter lacus]|nr:cupin domain-containing protein [Portibacter lacus]